MSVEAMRLVNFMAFEDTDWLEFGAITLLFGRNSSGKSVIVRALRLLKQSLDASAETGPLVFTTRAGIDQGKFENSVHGKDLSQTIVFGFRCNLADDERTLDVLGKLKSQLQPAQEYMAEPFIAAEDLKWVDVQIGFQGIEVKEQTHRIQVLPTLLRLEIPRTKSQRADEPTFKILTYDKLDYWTALELGDQTQWDSDLFGVGGMRWPNLRLVSRYEQDPNRRGFWPVFADTELLQGRADIAAFKFAMELYDGVSTQVDAFLNSIEYLGPLRPIPERVYVLNGVEVMEANKMGLKAFYQLVRGNVDAEVLDALNIAFREIDLGNHIDPRMKALQDTRDMDGVFAEVNVYEKEQVENFFNISDVGFGVSQVLPILATCFLAKRVRWTEGNDTIMASPGAFIIIEQPELHLHPEGQVALADLFIQHADEGRRFLIETHSEHILLRMQRRVAETHFFKIQSTREKELPKWKFALSHDSFRLFFVMRRLDGRNVVIVISIDQYGQLQDESDEFHRFFGYDYVDVTELNDVTAKIMYFETEGKIPDIESIPDSENSR